VEAVDALESEAQSTVILLGHSAQCLRVLHTQDQTTGSHLENTLPHDLQPTASVHPKATAKANGVSSAATELTDRLPETTAAPLEAIAGPSQATTAVSKTTTAVTEPTNEIPPMVIADIPQTTSASL